MISRDIYQLWAQPSARWTDWVRPLLFIDCDALNIPHYIKFTIPAAPVQECDKSTAIILDSPGYESVLEGLALAQIGYRPIPLYNGTKEQDNALALVDNKPIQAALVWGADQLAKIPLQEDAPPVFLLDNQRLLRHKMNVSVYDNSWDIYEQDMPSGDYLINHDIKRVHLISTKINRDLTKILYKYQQKGLVILHNNHPVRIPKPPKKDKYH